ncbi:MAG: cytidine deaminase [Bacteroidetes bacterium]|nr:cytidine deaminase [Bacteroidota bacterium]MBS1739839.1 cytidine deaminase [Bacteroidota bacterium]
MKHFQFSFQTTLQTKLPPNIQSLIEAAEQIAHKAYAPYSHFKVGAAVLLHDGNLLTGCNHENAAYPAGVCAERAALSSLDMSNGKQTVLAIAVTYLSHDLLPKPISPCGICRQTILEVQQWQNKPIAVYMCAPDGTIIVVDDAQYLLPFSFGSEYLDMPPDSH